MPSGPLPRSAGSAPGLAIGLLFPPECRFIPVRARLVAHSLGRWQSRCSKGFHLQGLHCHQSGKVGFHQLQVDLRISHVLLCRLQMSLRISQVGLSVATCSSAVISVPVDVSRISDGTGRLEPVTSLHSMPSRAAIIGSRCSIILVLFSSSTALPVANCSSARAASSSEQNASSLSAL